MNDVTTPYDALLDTTEYCRDLLTTLKEISALDPELGADLTARVAPLRERFPGQFQLLVDASLAFNPFAGTPPA